MPTVFLPGIGATMRTLGTRRAIARSSARPVIFDSRRPASSSTSYWAMTGPVSISTTLDVEAEVLERLLQDLGLAADFLLVLLVADVLVRQQQIERRQLVVGFGRRLLVGRFELFDDLLALGLWRLATAGGGRGWLSAAAR